MTAIAKHTIHSRVVNVWKWGDIGGKKNVECAHKRPTASPMLDGQTSGIAEREGAVAREVRHVGGVANDVEVDDDNRKTHDLQ